MSRIGCESEKHVPKIVSRVIAEAPNNFVIQSALVRCIEVIENHNKIVCAVSGGQIAM